MRIFDKKKFKLNALFILLLLTLLCSSSPVLAEGNAGTSNGSAGWTNDAYYKETEYMWKVSLFVAKSDTVSKDNATIDDFYRIGDDALYIIPSNTPVDLDKIIYSKGDKVKTLQELQSNGNNYSALNPVQLTTGAGVNRILDNQVPYIPQLCDGIANFNGVSDPNEVGYLPNVTEYFENISTIRKVLSYYANQKGTSMEGIVQNLEFTINGETRADWNPDGIIPRFINNNPTNQVEWILAYEPVGIVYTTGSRQGYALTATDFAVTQIKHQFDWRYDETRMSGWAGQQPDAWEIQSNRQHVARMAFLLMGNSVHTVTSWYEFKYSNGVDQNAAVPYSRWFSEPQIDYGGWGMVRYRTPNKYDDARNNDYRPNTDVILTTPVYSNKDSISGQELSVTYKINGETVGTDKVICPKGTQTTSSVKWHTPDVDARTEYDLEISVSPYPYGTIGGDGNEYVKKKVYVKPLKENPPPDPQVNDKEPDDFSINTSIPDPTTNKDGNLGESQDPTIKSVQMLSQPPIYKGNTVKVQVVTNLATPTLTLTNTDTGDSRAFDATNVGEGILSSREINQLSDEVVWIFEFIPSNLGTNHYSFTAQNPEKGISTPLDMAIDVSVDPDEPKIYSVEISPQKDIYTLYADTKSLPLQFQLIFNTDGGTDLPSQMVDYNKIIEIPIQPQKEGFSFQGWYKDNNFTEKWNFLTDKIKGVTTLYAKWEVRQFTVDFDLRGRGSAVPAQTIIYNDTVIKPEDPSDVGYNFEGWFTDSSCTTPWDFENTAVTSDQTLYAKWSPKNVVIYFEENGGSSVSDLVADYNSKISEPISDRPGYKFDHWYSDSTCTILWDFANYLVTSNMTLYAKWIALPAKIKFEPNGGGVVADLTGVTDQIITERTLPGSTRDHYVLDGWYVNSDLSGEVLTQLPEKFPVGEITYYAKWKLETHRLIDLFPDPGFAESIRIEMNKRADRLSDPIPDIYADVVNFYDLDYVTEINTLVSLKQLFADDTLAENIRIEMNKQVTRLSNPIPDIYVKVVTTTDLDYVKNLSINK